MTHLVNRTLIALAALTMGTQAHAATPFEQCPTETFLIQDAVPRAYGVDLSTGFVELLTDSLGTNNKLNGVGFSYRDALLYGWSYEHRTLARLGTELQVEPIALTQPLDDNYYVGDVTVNGSHYYAYKRGNGGSHGLWRIALDPELPGYLTPVRIINGAQLQLSIYDMAFHPSNGMLYSVTRTGQLVRIAPEDGSYQMLADLQEPGTYGAVYFDVAGNLYMSRNTDGAIFQVDPEAASPEAILFAQGPNSGQNDGARCALAPVIPQGVINIDFGDAPDSYGTTMASNGARHNTEASTLWLGNSVDAEAQAQPAPASDDAVGGDDEDGVVFISQVVAGETALLAVTANAGGYLSAWIDFDRNGEFDDSDRILDGRYLQPGQTVLGIDIPSDAGDGDTWSRFRFSSARNLGPTGGVGDGEVEDHPVRLFGRIVSSTYYPNPQGFVSLAYEDLWPAEGDYDLNDLVVSYRTTVNTASLSNNPGEVVVDSVTIEGEIAAIGASLHSGFAVELTGIPRAAVDQGRLSLTLGGNNAGHTVLEAGAGSEHAVLVVYPDAWQYVSADEGCNFYRTEDLCSGTAGASEFTLFVPLSGDVPGEAVTDQLFNPFIFGTNARRREVHLKNRAPTPRADLSALGTLDDASIPGANIYYQTATGMPWAIVIDEAWSHPEEAHDLLQTYPDFGDFVNSNGATNVNWHRAERAVTSKLYQE